MPVPTRRLAVVAAVAALLPLAFTPAPRLAWLVVNGVLLVLAAVDWVRAGRPAAWEVEREAPHVVALERAAEITWRVHPPRTGHGPRPARVSIADQLAPSLRADDRRVTVGVPAGGSATASTRITPSRRGLFALGDITIRVEGPWGLVARQARRPVPAALRVYPPFRSRAEAELRIERARILEVGLRSAKGRGGGTEFDALRDYTVDDEFRRIDWSATARAGRPIVRTYRAERNQHVLVMLDTGRTMAARLRDPEAHGAAWGEVPRLDHAMDAAMLVTALSTRLGDRTGLVAFSDRIRAAVPPGQTRDQLSRVTEAMFDLEPELVESDYRTAFASTLSRFRRRGLLVVLTELASEAVSETLLPALPMVIRTHLVVIAGVRDPAVERWARSVPVEPGAAYRKAAALAELEERRHTIARLRATGAVVVDEPPGRLAPRLGDAYLEIKAAGRL